VPAGPGQSGGSERALADVAEATAAASEPLGPGGSDRLRELVPLPGERTDPCSSNAPSGQRPPCRSSAAAAPLEVGSVQAVSEDTAQNPLAPPSPDVVVATSRQCLVRSVQGAEAREAVLRAKQAAEIARLTDMLRDLKKVHATEIERLRTEHAADLRRLVEALWHAQDAARAALLHPSISMPKPASGPRPLPRAQVERTRGWLAWIKNISLKANKGSTAEGGNRWPKRQGMF
jgi:hypothetical protein